jgi:hypothetical protein
MPTDHYELLTIGDLIAKLKKLPKDAPVYVANGSDEYGFILLKTWGVTYRDHDGPFGLYLG